MSLRKKTIAALKMLFSLVILAILLQTAFVVMITFIESLSINDSAVILSGLVVAIVGFGLTYVVVDRFSTRRRRTVIVLTVALWLVFIMPLTTIPGPTNVGPQPDPDADYSGVVASESGDDDYQDSYEVNLTRDETVRISIDAESQIRWSISRQNGASISGGIQGDQPDAVRQTENDEIMYTVPKDGRYTISVWAEPYTRASYSIYIDDSE